MELITMRTVKETKTTINNQRLPNLHQSIDEYKRLPLVYRVVMLGHSQNNGPWVFWVPGNLEFFEQSVTSVALSSLLPKRTSPMGNYSKKT